MKILLFICLIFQFALLYPQSSDSAKHKVYLIPGYGWDYRCFNNLKLDECFDTVHVHFILPDRKCDLKHYSRIIAQQIDTTGKFSLVGVSFGGMICSELSEYMHPEKIILVSSARYRKELPCAYRALKYVPVNKLIPTFLFKLGGQMVQPLIKSDRKEEKMVFKAMLKDKDPKFIKRTTNMIINWNKRESGKGLIQVHGDKDHILPIRRINPDYLVKNGSHAMIYKKGEELSCLLNSILLMNN